MALTCRGKRDELAALVELLACQGINSTQLPDGRLQIETDSREVVLSQFKSAKNLAASRISLIKMLDGFLWDDIEQGKLRTHMNARHCMMPNGKLIAETAEHPDRAYSAMVHDELGKRAEAAVFHCLPTTMSPREKRGWKELLQKHFQIHPQFVNDSRLLLSAELRKPSKDGYIGIWTCEAATALEIVLKAVEQHMERVDSTPFLTTASWNSESSYVIEMPASDVPGVTRDVIHHKWLTSNAVCIIFGKDNDKWHPSTAFPYVLDEN